MGGQHPLKGGITPPQSRAGELGRVNNPPHFLNVVFINQSIKNDSECRLHPDQQFQPIRTLHSGQVITKYHLIGAF